MIRNELVTTSSSDSTSGATRVAHFRCAKVYHAAQANAEMRKRLKLVADHQLEQNWNICGVLICFARFLFAVESGKWLVFKGKFWSG